VVSASVDESPARSSRRVGAGVRAGVVAALVFVAGSAAADGAFPDSNSLYVPSDRPHEIVLGTNFGLVITEDDGQTWHLVCEQAVATNVLGYQMSAAPNDTLYAATTNGVGRSTDNGCSWSFAGGALAGANVADIFPDAVDPNELFAIAYPPVKDGGLPEGGVFHSTDGALTFSDTPLYVATSAQSLTGVEKARAGGRDLYLTLYSYPPLAPALAHLNASGTFDLQDQSVALMGWQPYLAAVDPVDSNVLYLRLRAVTEALGISRDGGQTIANVFPIAGHMSAFLRRANGTLLMGSSDRVSLRSTDNGQTFPIWGDAPHVRALAERNGVLYVAADNLRDGFAVASSTDEGKHWTPLLRFYQIQGPAPCGNLPTVCAGPWAALQTIFQPPQPDAGVADLATDAPAPPPSPPAGRGRGCSFDASATPAGLLVSLLLVGALMSSRSGRVHRVLRAFQTGRGDGK
jgi:hypothetical protein